MWCRQPARVTPQVIPGDVENVYVGTARPVKRCQRLELQIVRPITADGNDVDVADLGLKVPERDRARDVRSLDEPWNRCVYVGEVRGNASLNDIRHLHKHSLDGPPLLDHHPDHPRPAREPQPRLRIDAPLRGVHAGRRRPLWTPIP
ncbi:MAG: hypothetical protein M3071_23240 [Actinomycetota bacterium]|nr:hypothetical protein [Actinomycetota bacterium]